MRILGQGLVVIVSVVAIASSFGCTPSGATGGQSGAGLELVNNKCTVCHTADRINQAKKDRAGWEQTVTRMRGKGAVLSDAEATQIVDYLSQAGAK